MRKRNLIGKHFGQLVIIAEVEPHITPSGARVPFVVARCDCGKTKEISVWALTKTSHPTISCGCWGAGAIGRRAYKYGDSWHRLRRIWGSMMGRCYKPRRAGYRYYGACGISVTEEWHDYPTFRSWAFGNGYAENLILDRIGNDRGYAPANCRWATQRQSSRNKRTNVWITAFGERKVQRDWATDLRCLISERTLRDRLKRGWKPETALTTPSQQSGRHRQRDIRGRFI